MRLARWGARVGLTALGALTISTCTDVLTAPGVGNVSLSYAGDTVLVLGSAAVASASAQVDGAALPRAQFAFSSTDTSIVAVRAGDSLVAKKRGSVTLTVTLVSSVLPSDPPSLARELTVVVDTVTLDSTAVSFASLGDTARLVATALDANGDAVSGAPAAWTTSDTSVVSVTTTGRLQAKGNGTAAVRAVVDFDTASVAVTVQQVLIRYTFVPSTVRIDALVASVQVEATGRDARGNAMTGVPPTWSVGDPSIALVGAASGVVTSLINGETFLYAERDTVRDSLLVIVDQKATSVFITPDPVPPITSIGDQVQLTARAFDRRVVEIQGAAPAWFTLDPALLRVSTEGLVTGLAVGTGKVVATLDGAVDTVDVAVSNDPASVEVTPDTAVATSVGDTLTFTATVRNGRGDLLTPTAGTPLTWRTPDPSVANVLADGRAITVGVGIARVIAASGTKADTGIVSATNQVATLDIIPDSRTLTSLGDTTTPGAIIRNARGANLGSGAVTWSVDDDNIARVSAAGLITARDTGVTIVRATADFLTDSLVLTVLNVPTSVTILGGRVADTLTGLGQELTYTLDVRNARGNVIRDYPVSWRSTARTVVDTIFSDNVATAIGFGTTLLIVGAAAAEDTVTFVVQNPTRLIVDNSIVASPRVGTLARPYDRIQDAVDNADANDTVVVRVGTGLYSETVALSRRITLLGDSQAFVNGTRNPALLPQIGHDSGEAGITAFTTAPQTIRYLALRHTLDGPAIDGFGSDMTIEWFYVNRPGSVTSNIGRGISVQSSPSATRITNTVIRNVRAYGIRLETVSSALVQSDSVIAVDSVAGVEDGSGIKLVGGATNFIQNNTVRQTQGPQIQTSGAAGTIITGNSLASRRQLMRVIGATGNNVISGNTFDMRFQAGDDGSGSAADGRSGLELNSSTGVTVLSNTFTERTTGGGSLMDAVRLIDTRATSGFGVNLTANIFKGGRDAVRSERSTFNVLGSRFDSAQVGLVLLDADTAALVDDTIATYVSGCVVSTGTSAKVTVTRGLYDTCTTAGGPAISVSEFGAILEVTSAVFRGPNTTAISASGIQRLTARSNTVSNVSGSLVGTPGVIQATADTVRVIGNTIVENRVASGVTVFGTNQLVVIDSNLIERNRRGVTLVGTIESFSARDNDIADNDTGVVNVTASGLLSVADNWFGDPRGPRRAEDPAATGDTTIGALTISPFRTTPLYPGISAASFRIVRGDGQSSAAGTMLPKAFTARVVDAAGLPVSGVSVQFSVTGGGGDFSGSGNVTVVTDASGLAEATLTLGASAGENTVKVSAGGLQDITFTATGL
ncbi:MAG: right-handed parallel beta-helix repeat-containing protein [Gemmatimonadetes bacterium]|nr:right-handed parallel beta-helix repeat-containing protein [Gemmatimonadota bacterium]